jgi:tRNA A-37 threonylcarbamoyl transferase component Bud32
MSVQKIGRYEIEKILGRGSSGVVYLARDPLIDRRVALKSLRVDLDHEYAEEFRERFMREARAAGRLNHPGIVTVHDVGEDPETGLMYIAMEYVEGSDIRQLIDSGYRFRLSEVLRITAEVAVALAYAHSLGVVHRDIKPANIAIAKDGSAKITDFGIARLETSNLTVDGQFIGTPNFMSPEQVTGKKVDGRSDIFSLGVVLFYLLTGERPFAGNTMHEVTLRVVQDPSPIPSTVGKNIPAALNPIVLKCLDKDPERRFQTGDELAKVLASVARSIVDREALDTASTSVHKPDLATRIHSETAPTEAARAAVTESAEVTATAAPPVTETAAAPAAVPESAAATEAAAAPATETAAVSAPPSVQETTAAAEPAAEATRAAAPEPPPPTAPPEPEIVDKPKTREGVVRLPEWMLWPVQLRWVWTIVGGSIVISAVSLVSVWSMIDRGPFVGPSEASTRNLNAVVGWLQAARAGLQNGDLKGAHDAVRAALDQVPTSEAGRALARDIRAAIERERTSAANQERVAALVAEGRRLYRGRSYDDAGERFREALELDPMNEIAAEFLELALERSAQDRAQRTPSTAQPSSDQKPPRSEPAVPASPERGIARVTLSFDSPINSGAILVTLDGESLAEVPFEFSSKGFLGIKRKGRGAVKRVILTPSGQHVVGVQLVGAKRQALGSASFTRELSPDSRWTLRVNLPNPQGTPDFVLVKAGR